jgi:hypothetical protein
MGARPQRLVVADTSSSHSSDGQLHSGPAKANRACILVLPAFFVPDCTLALPFWSCLGLPEARGPLPTLVAAIQAHFPGAVTL